MKKFYNILLSILIIIAIIVGTMLIIKYGGNYLNDKQLKETVAIIEEKMQNGEKVESSYNGYEIEGIIEIPKIGIKYPIINSTTDASMKVSVTKLWGPEKPNEIGNYIIAGHNNRDGTMFGKTKKLEIGDEIKLTDLNNNTIKYKIFDKYSIDPNNLDYVNSIEPETKEITLMTCTNGHKERLIIKAREEK